MKTFILTTFILTFWFANCQNDDEKLIYTNARLPTNVYPIEYDLNVTTYLPGYNWKADDRNMSYEGIVTIRLGVKESTDVIVIHSDIKTQTINEIIVTSKNNKNVKVVTMVPSFEDQFLNIKLNEQVYPGDEVEIALRFIVFLRHDNRGYYITKSERNGVTMLNAVTQFETVDARFMMPCFDEPELKATWKVTLKYPTGAVALTNTIEEESFEDGDFTVTTYKRTVRMSSYLVAIFIGDVKYKETKSESGTRIRVYADPERIGYVDMALNQSRIVLEGFEKHFGIDFPMEKLDFVSVNDFAAGAMENWGLIVHKDYAILGGGPLVTGIVIHELAHQWFGNLVTMKYWNQTWLNEGFATYMTSYGQSLIYPEYNGEKYFTDQQEEAMIMDSKGALDSIIDAEDGSIKIQDINYPKGASFIRMMEKIVGTDNFDRAIRNYLHRHQFSNVEDIDLYAELEAVREPLACESEGNQISIESFARCWTHQNAYPTVFVTKSDNGVILTQRREKDVKSDYKKYDDCGYKWDIPIWYQRAGDRNVELIWFKKEDYELELKVDGPVFINADSNGYYDVVYSEDLYELIAKDLESNKKIYSSNTKRRLLGDAFYYGLKNQIFIQNAALLARPLLDDEDGDISFMAHWVMSTAINLMKRSINRSTEVIKALTINETKTPEVDISTKCDTSSSLWKCVSEHFETEFNVCILMATSRSNTSMVLEWLKTENTTESRQKLLKLLSCRSEEVFKRFANDQNINWTSSERRWIADHLKIIEKPQNSKKGDSKSRKFKTSYPLNRRSFVH